MATDAAASEVRRWENYRRANTARPSARENELRRTFELTKPQKGERIWEAGTGNGYLTFPLALAVGEGGAVITTDVEEGNIRDVVEKNKGKRLPIEPILLPLEDPLLRVRYEQTFDAAVSIATLHHFDNRTQRTGMSGRLRALTAFYHALKPGGRLVLSDVLHGTITQRYFDSIDDPKFCHPHGHPHDFFTAQALVDAAESAGFRDISVEVQPVPWRFGSPQEARQFVHIIHNATCSPEESFALAEKILGFTKTSEGWELGWELFFLTARK